MPITTDAILKDHSHSYIRDIVVPSGVTRAHVSTLIDEIVDSKVSRNDRPITPQGNWDATTDVVPNNGDATVLAGYQWESGDTRSSSLLGPDGNIVLEWATLRALVDNPGIDLTDRTKWKLTY
jgi:hypothetical protein